MRDVTNRAVDDVASAAMASRAGKRAPIASGAKQLDYFLHFRSVSKRFPIGPKGASELLAIRDVTLGVRPNELVAVIGPSGCGKSTLLSLGAGLDRPSSGEVTIAGQLVDRPHTAVAFMLQKDLLLPWRTIQRNVEYGMEVRGVSAEERRERAASLLNQFGLHAFAAAYPHQLSGGMRQRAALARTMALQPKILLLDEPFSALDAQTKMALQEELAHTIRNSDTTAVFITHDLTEAVVLADRIYVMSDRPGTIIKEIDVDLPFRGDPVERYFHTSTVKYVREIWSILSTTGHAPSNRP